MNEYKKPLQRERTLTYSGADVYHVVIAIPVYQKYNLFINLEAFHTLTSATAIAQSPIERYVP